ncbi:post-GPI attachment to proteins factor 3-like [Antedon mediterranea]|uniref:post-GPI attachment to proteins factor 3-like n=1 Tax=Antedon mediterranea TaxID=105859 RepID=UPI003AF4F5CF
MMYCAATGLITIFLFSAIKSGGCSKGDHHPVYRTCLHYCIKENCSMQVDVEKFEASRAWYLNALQWHCQDECRYDCMWVTVEYYDHNKIPCPQFHGKWPFQRIFGIQELASVVFSICHAVLHLYFWWQFRLKVPSAAPMYSTWQIYSMISMNAWLWSTVFHTRDLIWTERMDYFCATSLVLASLLAHCIRVLGWYGGILHSKITCLCIVVMITLFSAHVYYLSFVKFDYGYNMKVNVAVGAINTIWIVLWSVKNMSHQPYVWKAMVTVIGTSLLLLLELGDFAPIGWIFDAHSIWHGATIPLVVFWYSYIIDDCLYMYECMMKFKKTV